jgi:hypothetical protein
MAFGQIANARWFRAEESESVSAMLDTVPNIVTPGVYHGRPVLNRAPWDGLADHAAWHAPREVFSSKQYGRHAGSIVVRSS